VTAHRVKRENGGLGEDKGYNMPRASIRELAIDEAVQLLVLIFTLAVASGSTSGC
jgi:hypothetical protein